MLLPTLALADISSPTHTVGDGTGSRVTKGNHSIDDVNGSNTNISIGDDGDDIINGGDNIDGDDSIDTGFNDGESSIAVSVDSVGDSADVRVDEFEVNDDSIGDGVIT